MFNFTNGKKSDFDIFMSLTLLIIFLSALTTSIHQVSLKNSMTNLEWYILFVLIGISCILWCYFKWRQTSYMSLPRFTEDDESTKKKAIIFLLVFIFSVVLGYKQVLSYLKAQHVDSAFYLTNATIVAGMIAFDRFLNQIHHIFTK